MVTRSSAPLTHDFLHIYLKERPFVVKASFRYPSPSPRSLEGFEGLRFKLGQSHSRTSLDSRSTGTFCVWWYKHVVLASRNQSPAL